MSCPPWRNTSNAAPAISRVSCQHLYRFSLYIIRWYHTVTPYHDTSRVPNYSSQQLFTLPSLRMVEYHSTPPIPKSFGLLSRALVIVSYPMLFLPPAVSPSHRLPHLAYSKPFGQPLHYSPCTPYRFLTSIFPLALSLVSKYLFRPRVRLLPRSATGATRSRRDCDVTLAPPPSLLGEPDRMSPLLRNYLTGTRREGRDREDSGIMTSPLT